MRNWFAKEAEFFGCLLFLENFVLFWARIIKCIEDLVRMTALWKNVKNSLWFDPFLLFIQLLECPAVPILPDDRMRLDYFSYPNWVFLKERQMAKSLCMGNADLRKKMSATYRMTRETFAAKQQQINNRKSAYENWWKIISNEGHNIFF